MKKKRETFVQALGLPKDLCLGAAILTAVGSMEITIENHKGLLEYDPDCIRILSGMCRIRIEGSDLSISYFGRDSMKITGRIQKIIYE